jgi:hypothetical protein
MNSQGPISQRYISAQADLAVRHYCETTPVVERSAIEILECYDQGLGENNQEYSGPFLLRSTYPLHTLTMDMISFMRYSLDLKSLLNSIHPIQPLTLLISNHFYFVYRLTAILMSSLRQT